MSTRPLCECCERPIHDTAYVCTACADRLARDLQSVVAVAGEAWTTIARLSRLGHSPGKAADQPLPFSWEAADATWAAANTLTTWARHIADERGIALPVDDAPRLVREQRQHPLAVTACWLAAQLGWLRYRPEAGEAFDELTDACRLAVRTVDLPPVRWYAGPCGCGTDLYAAPSASIVRCRECGTDHDADARRSWLLDIAEDQLVHASLAAAAITALGLPCKDATVRKWAERGRLTAHGTDHRGRPLYRVGDVRMLAADTERCAGSSRNLTPT